MHACGSSLHAKVLGSPFLLCTTRLDNNSLAVDTIQEHRALWFQAGGVDPDLLATPTKYHLDAVAKTVQTLNKMLEKHGPTGGLDSFVEALELAAAKLKVVSWESIREDRFSLTPKTLYDELTRTAQNAISSWGDDYQRRQTRMVTPMKEDEIGKEEAKKRIEGPQTRPQDKYGLVLALDRPHIP